MGIRPPRPPSSINRIYVGNFNSDNVSVIDGASNNIIATVTVGDGPALFGITANPVTNRIYVPNLDSINVSVIDGVSNTVLATLTLAQFSNPTGADSNPITNLIYVSDQTLDPNLTQFAPRG
ncbi:hypothetical protein [Paenibacillus sp. LHD-38]|uniref:YncE family protein n=1 Tax=Paenibacillus sp. LHD-38 TaxID=3072143 RepID=UPI00280F6BE5|nr:hypothetical protein [Paenibacillus sp. LHD-38]MDQ8739018.1 hypothetical protein [Paenibacillus sp. LHD-38]